jgi:hypothetical protein
MFDSSSELVTKAEIEMFEQFFKEKAKDGAILFTYFKEILTVQEKFDSPHLIDIIEKLRKKLKEKLIGYNDNELIIGKYNITIVKNDYLAFIESIAIEINQYENMNDEEFSICLVNIGKIFDSLTGSQSTLERKYLMDLFYQFELPLSCNEFLEPVGNKDMLEFADFAMLFKCRKFREVEDFIRNVDDYDYMEPKKVTGDKTMFPVTITNFGKKKSNL